MHRLAALILGVAVLADCKEIPGWVEYFVRLPHLEQEAKFKEFSDADRLDVAIYAPQLTRPPDTTYQRLVISLGKAIVPLAVARASCATDDAFKHLVSVLSLVNERRYRLKSEDELHKRVVARLGAMKSEGQQYETGKIVDAIWPPDEGKRAATSTP
ncbi:MAG: hypothetical protein JST92_09475 [Deltaproteobacteria bacterium]|nr:hypothetical protein [Deltaproteobacteria bacterium]